MKTGEMPQVLTDLAARVLSDGVDEAAWLDARRGVVTATEAKIISHGTSAARSREAARLLKEKVSGERSFFGNHFTEWGNLREPVILAELAVRFGFAPGGALYFAEECSLHAATPDAVRVNFDGLLELAEIKTSKKDVSPGSEAFVAYGYEYQMQWQMYVLGAQRNLYVYEKHDDDWSGWTVGDWETYRLETGPRVEPIGFRWFERDDSMIAEMIAAADAFLVSLDVAVSTGEIAEPEVDLVLDALAVDLLAARVTEGFAKRAREGVWLHLQETAAGWDGDVSQRSDAAQVSWSAPTSKTVSVPDRVAAENAAPALVAEVAAAEAALAEVRDRWSVHAAGFVMDELVSSPGSLTVTAVKAKKEKKA
jgi:hypothetical protein